MKLSIILNVVLFVALLVSQHYSDIHFKNSNHCLMELHHADN